MRRFFNSKVGNAATLARFRATTPSKANLAGYLQHMKSMMIQQHEHTTKVAMHLQLGQKVEYDALTKHSTRAFEVCNTDLAAAMNSMQESAKGVKKDVRIMLQEVEEDVEHLRQAHIE